MNYFVKKQLINTFIVFVLLMELSCKKQINLALTSVATNYLAVDGVILSGDSTFITLSRTTSLKDTTHFKAELKATVAVENDQKILYPLTEKTKGLYVLGVTNFDPARKYRLDIKTNDGKIYQSDFVPMKITPQIDSVYKQYPNDDRLEFYVSTHDPSNKTRYYRWDYREDWQYYALAHDNTFPNLTTPAFNFVNGSLVETLPQRDFTTCYATGYSNEILINSSAKLSDDIITKQPVGVLVSNSQKIERMYTIQIRQYALTEDGFNYYQNIKKNTEQLGTIFDITPLLTLGNIHCVSNANEAVIGFISASTVTTNFFVLRYNDVRLRNAHPGEMIFPDNPYKLNPTYVGPPFAGGCDSGEILFEPKSTFSGRLTQLLNGNTLGYIPFIHDYIYNTINGVKTLVGYSWRKRDCVDCRVINHEGSSSTLIRPSFFPPD